MSINTTCEVMEIVAKMISTVIVARVMGVIAMTNSETVTVGSLMGWATRALSISSAQVCTEGHGLAR